MKEEERRQGRRKRRTAKNGTRRNKILITKQKEVKKRGAGEQGDQDKEKGEWREREERRRDV